MAINPNILLTPTTPTLNIGQGLLRGIQGLSSLQQMQQEEQMAPIRQKMLEAQAAALPVQTQAQEVETAFNRQRLADLEQQAEILRSATTANLALPAIERKDLAAFQQVLSKSNLPEDQRDYLSLLGEANRWDELKTIADKEIETAKLTGQFGKESAQYVSDLQRFMAATPEQQQSMLAFKRGEQIVDVGGVKYRLSPSGEVIPVVGESPMPPPPGSVDLNQPIDDQPSTKPTMTPAEATARNAAAIAAAKTTAEKEAVRMGDYEKDVQHHKSMRRGLDAVFEDEGYAGLFKDLPQGKLSSAVNNAISTFMGGTKGKDAEARVNQLGRMIIQGVPYDPGAQSNAEMDARAALVGSFNDPNVSTDQKIKSIKAYFRFIDERNVSGQEALSDYYERNPAITPPAWYRASKAAQTGSTYDREYDPKTGSYIPRGR